MKKYLMIAVAVLALAACNKEQERVRPVNQDEEVILTFTSERPQVETGTRTAWDATSHSIIWSSTDKIRVGYKLNGNWMGQSASGTPKFYESAAVSINSNDPNLGTFSVPIDDSKFHDPEIEGSYVFYSFFPSAAAAANNGANTVNSAGIASLIIPDSQSPAATSFDPSADIMIGKSAAIVGGGLPTTPISIAWNRLVAHVDLTFSNLDFDGAETVSEIMITSSGKLAGTFTANMEDGTLDTQNAVNTIHLDGANLTAGNSSVEAWASVLPGAFTSLEVMILTDKATYTRNITGLSGMAFKKNARNTLTVNMATATRTELPAMEFEEFTGTLEEGLYIIYDEVSGVAMKAEVDNNKLAYTAVTPVDGVISTTDESIQWYISASETSGYWTILSTSENKYAAATGSKNQAQLLDDDGTDDKSLWSSSGTYEFLNKARAAGTNPDNKYLRYNPGNGFACYSTSTGHTLSLYKFDSREPLDAPATVSAVLDQTTPNAIVVTFDDQVTDADSYVITATPTAGGDAVKKTGVAASPATIDGLAYSTEYTISVYAVPATDDLDHKHSAATAAANPVTTGARPVQEGYELLSSNADVPTGQYIIAAKVGSSYIGMPNTFGTSPFAGSALTVNNGYVSTSNAAGFVVTIKKNNNQYTIIGADNKVLGYGSSTNFSLSATGNNALWTIASGSYGSFRIANVGSTSRAIVYRTGNTNKFGAYSTGNINGTEYFDVELFKLNGKGDPTISVSPASPINLLIGNTQQLSVFTTTDGAVSYQSSDASVASVSATGLITAVAAGTATITVSTAETSAFNVGSTTVTVNVSAPSYAFTTVAELNALATSTATQYIGTLTDAIVSFVPNTSNAIIKDATGSVLFYKSGHGLLQGQTFSGEVTVTVKLYNSCAQITTCDAQFTGSETAVAPATVTLAQLAGNLTTYQNAYVQVSGLEVTAVSTSSSGKNYSVTDGNNSYVVFAPSAATCVVGDVLTVKGTIAHYGQNDQIKVWDKDDITVTYHPVPTHTINFSQPASGGTFTVSVDGSNISTGDSVQEGKTVTLTASPATGYHFSKWTVSGATVSGNTSPATFVVESSNVTISATFVSNTGGAMTVDFENAENTYSDWTFTNMTSQQTGSITAHGGTYYGTTGGKATASIVTAQKVSSPRSLTCYVSRQTTNTTASTWYIQVSNDGTAWTNVNTQDAKSMTKGSWVEFTADLSSCSNVYVRVYYSGSTAVRNIDDLTLTYN